MTRVASFVFGLVLVARMALGGLASELGVGRGFHAFDHLGNIGEQADAAAASGINIIYATGVGGVGYMGLPNETELAVNLRKTGEYNQRAREKGIRVIFGYVCATSIVKLDTFDANWSAKFREQFKTRPTEWRQVGRDGKPLPSWYGGDYQPACMNNPDWRAYEEFIVHQQLSCGHDGIFFDNPTVHPKGCYCLFCMEKFAAFLRGSGMRVDHGSVETVRQLADKHPVEFMRFRCTIARDFLAEIRRYARTIKSDALITCNNSLNSPDALFSQARTYGYNIYEKSKAEDLVVVEDMNHQPRLLSNGRTLEYGPTYRQLAAINHGKSVVAVTIAEADYHTAPNLVRLAMAEAVAHEASYLAWPTWPTEQRSRMANSIRPQAELFRQNEKLLNDATARADVLLFLPMQRFTETNRCAASELAAALSSRNVQYRVVAEDDLATALKKSKAHSLVVESESVLDAKQKSALANFERNRGAVFWANKPEWLNKVASVPASSLELTGPATLRAVVRDQRNRTLVHLYNLAIERLSSFEDRVHPADDVAVRVRVPFSNPRSVAALTADAGATQGSAPFTVVQDGKETWVHIQVSRIEIGTILVIER